MSAPKIVNDKRTLYVGACARAPRRPLVGGSHPTSPPGGLEESVTTEILHAAFLPFGEITDVNLVLDAATRARLPLKHVPRAPVLLTSSSLLVCAEKHRGFAFVQFEDRGDAADAIDNMNNAELFGRVLKVNVAKPSAAVGGHRPGARLSPPPPALAHSPHSSRACVRIRSVGVASRHVL